MVYVGGDIPSQENPKAHKLPANVEGIMVEINLRKMKFLLISIYHSTNKDYGTTDDVFLCEIGKVVDVYSSFDSFLIVGDFNMQEGNSQLDDFLCTYHAKNLVKEPTCFKSPENPSCVDLFVTYNKHGFTWTHPKRTGMNWNELESWN